MSYRSRIYHTKNKQSLSKQVMTGTIATLIVVSAEKLMLKVAKHPLLVFGLGMAGGVIVYKYRKVIIDNATKTLEKGKAIVLEKKEKLLDIVAETKEMN